MRFVPVGAIVAAVLVVAAPSAGASTIRETSVFSCLPLGQVSGSVYCVAYDASPGERNNVIVGNSPAGATNLNLSDSGGLILPSTSGSPAGSLPCITLVFSATCLGLRLTAPLQPAFVAGAVLNLGDGNDSATGGAGSTLVANGGAGDDRLQAGSSSGAVLTGGPGADVLVGGPTADALYDDHTSGVSVTLDGLANDGSPGERDNVLVPNVLGSNVNDTLIGNGQVNFLGAGSGTNFVSGGAGNDVITGTGTDTFDGGDGNDAISSLIGNGDQISGGNGDDGITTNGGGSFVDGGAGNDAIGVGAGGGTVVDGGSGDDRISATNAPLPERSQTINCGPGNDTVFADPSDIVNADCEHVTIS
jgi:Ca2+-binding RTX toxin-like protein